MSVIFSKKKSLDLLTEQEASAKFSGNKVFSLVISILILISLLIIFAVLFFLNLRSKNELASLETNLTQKTASQGELGEISSSLEQIKSKLQNYDQITGQYEGMKEKLEKVTDQLPEVIKLLTLTVNKDGKVSLDGSVQNPTDAYQFYQTLSNDPTISNLSLDTVAKVGNSYTFDLTFTLKLE